MPTKVDDNQCIGCKKCYNLCPLDVFTWQEEIKKPKVTYEEECWHCGICWMECPKRAIDLVLPPSLW